MRASFLLATFVSMAAVLAQTHTPAECQQVNQFLCQTQCGKVLIQCTGAGTGVALEALDEAAAVCNNGQIDFATNCQTSGGATAGPAPAPAPVPAPAPAAGGASLPPTAAGAAVAFGTACAGAQIACGPTIANPKAGNALQDTIAICNSGVFTQLDFCDEGTNKCQVISGTPYCI